MMITLAWEQIPIFSLCYEATWDKNNYKILFRSTESLDALVKTENFQMEISVYSSILSTYYFWTMKHANMHKIISQLSARLTWESLHLFEGSGGAKRWREREGKKKRKFKKHANFYFRLTLLIACNVKQRSSSIM